jgi:acetyl-CoA acetyltransferase
LNLSGEAAIVGVGYTDFTQNSGRSVLSLATEACRAAVEDAGLPTGEVDGIVSFSFQNDSVTAQAVACSLALPRLNYCLDLNLGGQAPCFAVMHAAMAIAAGLARNVLVYRALNGRSGERVGSRRFKSPTAQYRYPIGLTAYSQYIAMWARRYMIETGTTYEHLGAVAVQSRWYAERNRRALRRTPLSTKEYFDSPFVVDPFRVPDCTIEVDGGCAVLVTSTEAARELRRPPAVIQGAAWVTGGRSGLDIGDVLSWPDYRFNFARLLAGDLWRSAGMSPADMDFAEIYDCFSSVLLYGLEGLGLVPEGEAGPFVAAGETALTGSLPVNTHGGLLNEGYLHGMNTVAEAVLQIQGRGEDRQVADARAGVVTSGGLVDGSALILVRDSA